MGSHEPFKRFITADPSWRVLFIKDFHTFFFFLASFFFVEFPFLFFVGFCFLSLLLLRRFYGGLTAGWRWVSGGRSGWPASTTRAASWRNAVDAVVDDDEVIWNETNVCRNEEECHRFSSSSSPFFWLLFRFFLNFFYVRACVCVCVCGTEGKFFIWKIKVKKKKRRSEVGDRRVENVSVDIDLLLPYDSQWGLRKMSQGTHSVDPKRRKPWWKPNKTR